MSYVIGNIVYGCPINDALSTLIEQVEMDEAHPLSEYYDDDYPLGFETYYSGHAYGTVGAFGVSLGRINECSNVRVGDLTLEPTEEQKADVEKRFAELPKAVRDLCDPLDTYIVWSTS